MRSRSLLAATVVSAALTLSACTGDVDVDVDADADGNDDQAIAVTADDDACDTDESEVEAGTIVVQVTNVGEQTTDVYVYADGDRVVGEVENITPGLVRTVEMTLGGGQYQIACKPGQTGDGIRTPLVVTGDVIDAPVEERTVEVDAADYEFRGLEDELFAAGDIIGFSLSNVGEVEHDFEVFGPDGVVLGEVGPTLPGSKGAVVLELSEPGIYRYICDIEDHEDRGMLGEFEVTG